MLELVFIVGRSCRTDEQIVTKVTRLIRRGRVSLCGNFAGCKI